jgi:ankyrin repeat protein
MGGKKLLKNIVLGSFFMSSCLFGMKNEITPRKTLENKLLLAIDKKNEKLVEHLLKKGANPNAVRFLIKGEGKEYLGLTALSNAALFGNVKIVRLLLNYGADPNLKTDRSDRPLHRAVGSAHKSCYKIVRLLLNRKADPNARRCGGQTPLMCLVEDILVKTKYYRSYVKKRVNVAARRTFRDIACRLQILKLLVDHGADINAQDDDGNTILHTAASFGFRKSPNLKLFKECIKLGVDVDIPNRNGDTPLDFLLQRKKEIPNGNEALNDEYDKITALFRAHGATFKVDNEI